MSVRRSNEDELAGLDPVEAHALREVADMLRADRFVPEDEHFWDALQQRISNEVAVTSLPSDRDRARPQPRSLSARLNQLFRGLRARPAAILLPATAILAIWLLFSTTGEGDDEAEPAPSIALPSLQEGDDSRIAQPEGVEIPEELWSDGFLAHGSIEADEEDALDAYADEWSPYAGVEDAYPDNALYYSSSFVSPWGLEELTEEELIALEALLEG